MANRKWTFALSCMVFAFYLTPAMAETKIGSGTARKNRVEGIVGGKSEPIASGTNVYSNEVIRTAPNSVADLKFVDESDLSIGPTSEIVLDKFVYDPTGSTGAVVIN